MHDQDSSEESVDRDGSLAAHDPLARRLKNRQWGEEMLPGRGKLYVLNTNQANVSKSLCVSIWASAGEKSYNNDRPSFW